MGLSLKEVEVQQETPVQAKVMTEQERAEAIKRQVEYYFSRQNLLQDTYLLSKMDKEFYVDLSVIAEFKMMKQLTTDVDLILSTIKGSDKIIIDEAKKRIKPAPNTERTTLILRNIPSSASEESVKKLLDTVNVPAILSIRADVGDNWFLSFESQEATKTAMERVKSLKWEDKSIGCAIKSESFLKGLALLPANGAHYQATAPFVPGEQGTYRSNGGRRAHGAGRRNVHTPNSSGDYQDSHGKKNVAGKKGKGRSGTRDSSSKENTQTETRSPQNQKSAQAPLKPSDFPVLGSSSVEGPAAEANSAASTPPLCNTPPLNTPTSGNEALSDTSISKAKISYAQIALASVANGSNGTNVTTKA